MTVVDLIATVLLNLKDATQVKCLVLIVLALLMASAPTSAQPRAISKDQIREFLLAADVIAAEQTGTGTTRPWRLTLSDGTLTHDAHFQSVDRHEGPRRFGDRLERTFIDSYRYNIAAYGLAEGVGLGDMMPVRDGLWLRSLDRGPPAAGCPPPEPPPSSPTLTPADVALKSGSFLPLPPNIGLKDQGRGEDT